MRSHKCIVSCILKSSYFPPSKVTLEAGFIFFHLYFTVCSFLSFLICTSCSTVALAGHPDGNVFAGINMCEFLALPPRALVSISFAGEETTQGFLGLRKL